MLNYLFSPLQIYESKQFHQTMLIVLLPSKISGLLLALVERQNELVGYNETPNLLQSRSDFIGLHVLHVMGSIYNQVMLFMSKVFLHKQW